MEIHRAVLLTKLFAFALLVFLVPIANAQNVPSRITQAVDNEKRVTLRGNTYPLARPEYDRGTAPDSLPMERMLLVLTRSPEQESALTTLLDEQQDKSSPNFHKWVTPEQFGQQFGSADADIQAVMGWLTSQGFRVNSVAKGRTVIEFSGDAGLVRNSFHTQIHKYVVNGEEHWANASDPQIPAALTPVVAGVATLHNFYKRPQVVMSDWRLADQQTRASRPLDTLSGGQHALSPADYAVIYNINPLYQAGITGTGTTIAVVGRSNINLQDVTDFRNFFGLPVNAPQRVLNGPDPGIVSGEELEADLDVEWSGAVAPNATVKFVVSASTLNTDGVDLSEIYIIDNNLGNVMTESFGVCEAAFNGDSADVMNKFLLAEQAAAQGITYMVSAGDAGAEGCDNPNSETVAAGPISVNVLASTPFTVAVGGTMFNENGQDSKFWKSTNGQNNESAISYIPEDVWNESCTAGTTTCQQPNIFAGGGGTSQFFSKPSWQSGVAGIPIDGMRVLPDVSLAAAGHDPYLICIQGSCSGNPGAQGPVGVRGTSAAAPSFAAIMALVNQKTGSRQGQADYVLYRLAATETLSQCNGSNTTGLPASNCIFNDVTVGNNAVPGEVGFGTPGAMYPSGVGYDLATGLGSVNAANLVNNWSNARSTPSTITLTLSPTNTAQGTTVNVNITVSGVGAGTPTGDVGLIANAGTNGQTGVTLANFTLSGGILSTTTSTLPAGSYTVIAHYEGDGTFLPSDSSPVQVVVTGGTASPPVLSTISPTSALVGSAAFTLSVSGSNFISGAVINFNGQPQPTTSVSSTSLTAAISASSIAAAGSFSVTVTNPAPNGGTSAASTFTVNNPLPVLNSISPTSVAVGSPAFTLSVSGSNFNASSVVNFNGQAVSTTFVSATALTASIPATDVATAASDSVTVSNPAPGGGTSTAASFSVSTSDFVLNVAGGGNATITAGQTAIYKNVVSLTDVNGFSFSVVLSCSTNAPMSTCSAAPSSLVQGTNATIRVFTTQHGSVLPWRLPTGILRHVPIWLLLMFATLFLTFAAQNRRRRLVVAIPLALVLLSIMFESACASNPTGGTSVGNYTVSVTGVSGTIAHTITLGLTVK
jgi:subtilase family serine protease